MVFDIGGGTFDVTVLDIFEQIIDVKSYTEYNKQHCYHLMLRVIPEYPYGPRQIRPLSPL